GYYVVINLKKGGVFRLYGNGRIFNDSGIIATTGDKILTTNCNDSSNYRRQGNEILVEGCFKEITSIKRLSPQRNILLRGFLLTMGGSPAITSRAKEFFRKKLILEAKDSRVLHKRRFLLDDSKVTVIDEVRLPEDLEIDAFYFPSQFSSSYSPTSAFFDQYSLIAGEVDDAEELREGPVRREFILK
ncbi:MAG: hypothetical protein QF858_02250, partial [Candidatus Pacebacteria bacterium]|nr:hypothetical protein [Candidatus Paceibacterota bacterium]